MAKTDMTKTDSQVPATVEVDPASLTLGRGAAAKALAENRGYHLEQVLSLREGDAVKGVYLGPGGIIVLSDEKVNQVTGEVTNVTKQSWKVAVTPQVTVILPGSYKLDQFFSALAIGTHVVIEHMGQQNVGGGKNRVNRYACLVLKTAPGAAKQLTE